VLETELGSGPNLVLNRTLVPKCTLVREASPRTDLGRFQFFGSKTIESRIGHGMLRVPSAVLRVILRPGPFFAVRRDSGRYNKASDQAKESKAFPLIVQKPESRVASAAWTYLSLKWAVIEEPSTTVSVTSQQVFPMLGVFQL